MPLPFAAKETNYRQVMNTAQFKRELMGHGAKFIEGGKHTKVYLNGKQATLPRHREISDQLAKVILKQLGLK
jgi:mRNA interferase HicA